MEIEISELPNGLRSVFQRVDGEVVHCGLTIKAGSRDESKEEEGLAHYIEHILFKGTKKRKAYHILSRLDAVGGELNAYTTKEETVIFASFQKQYFERAVELIADIIFNSTFPEKELLKEKDVIIDEIHSYLDSPSEQIFDDFEEIIYKNHPIAHNILGTEESVRALTKEHVLEFMKKYYVPSNMVFSCVGDISLKKVKKTLEKHFKNYSKSETVDIRKADYKYISESKKVEKETHQVHCMIGNIAYSSHDEKKRRGLILLNNILGGPAMNSRLNLSIREKYGYTYNLESNYTPYSDTGNFAVYYGTDLKTSDRTMELIQKELKKMRDSALGVNQLNQAKLQLKGQIALSQENRCNVMLALGKTLLLYNEVDSLEKVYESIDALTSSELLEISNEIFNEKEMTALTYYNNEKE